MDPGHLALVPARTPRRPPGTAPARTPSPSSRPKKQQRGTTVTLKLKRKTPRVPPGRPPARDHPQALRFHPLPDLHGLRQTGTGQPPDRHLAAAPREVEQKDYDEFYQQLTLDFEPPLAHTHMVVDAPVQMYAMLFVPPAPSGTCSRCAKKTG